MPCPLALRKAALPNTEQLMHMQLLIADHFDTLASGKVLAVGLFTDRVVLLNVPADAADPSPEVPFGIDLGLLITLSDTPPGPMAGEISIHPPGSLPPVAVLRFTGIGVAAGYAANVMTKLQPLLVPCPGIFAVHLKLGDDVWSETFEVRVQRQPLPLDLTAAAAASQAAKPVLAKKAARKRTKA